MKRSFLCCSWCITILFGLSLTAQGSVIFSDDFNRPDGAVGNGWTTFFAGSLNDPNIYLSGGQLRTAGFPGEGGGIFRSLAVDLSSGPIEFSFDFRTLNEHPEYDPSLPYNDGGWQLFLNANTSGPSTINYSLSQFRLIHYAGSRNMQRGVFDGATMVYDLIPGLPEPIPNHRDYSASFAHVFGTINPDLSASVSVYYNDGQSPDPVTFLIGAPSGPASEPLGGASLVLMNANWSFGPHYFDNFEIRTSQVVPEPGSFMLAAAGCLGLVIWQTGRRRKPGALP